MEDAQAGGGGLECIAFVAPSGRWANMVSYPITTVINVTELYLAICKKNLNAVSGLQYDRCFVK